MVEHNPIYFWELDLDMSNWLWQAYSLLLEKGPIANLGRVPQAGFYQAFGLGLPLHGL
jgi:hypothetical protein